MNLSRTLFSFSAVILLLAWRISTPKPEGTVLIQRPLMGTLWSIEIADRGRPSEASAAIDAAYAELGRIDQLMSEWKPMSPISQVNDAAGERPVAVPEELRELLERSKDYHHRSLGTFDITWRGMGSIWKFDDQFKVPSKEAVETARQRVNSERIQIRGNLVYLPKEMNIGLGGIAKGYAVDRAMQVLLSRGFADALVNGGGDVLVHGSRMGESWRLGIQNPRAEHGTLIGTLPLHNAALVTSGDYERFRIVDGIRYHHIINPRTGWPAKASISVTVIAPSTELGVVMSKALFILGPERGLRLAAAEKFEALIIDPSGKRHQTPGFPALHP